LFPWLLIHTDHRALPNPNTTATAGVLLTGSSSPTILPSWIILRRSTSARRKKMTIHQSIAANFGVYKKHQKHA